MITFMSIGLEPAERLAHVRHAVSIALNSANAALQDHLHRSGVHFEDVITAINAGHCEESTVLSTAQAILQHETNLSLIEAMTCGFARAISADDSQDALPQTLIDTLLTMGWTLASEQALIRRISNAIQAHNVTQACLDDIRRLASHPGKSDIACRLYASLIRQGPVNP